ncbi:MAG TPA: DNA-formamidopyrimidine glycosylase family protein [Actinopolymorphaceae bacterium]
MPELPDDEGVRRVLAEHATDAPIDRVDVIDPGVVRDIDEDRFREELDGRMLAEPTRHGKWLLAPLHVPEQRHRPEDPTLIFHFGMTGSLDWSSRDDPRDPYDRVVLGFGDRELRFRDMRKLRGVRLASDDDGVRDLLDGLGPDAAAVSLARLRERLAERRGRLKSTLMNQDVIAGLGNLLVDEILWRARLHPRRKVSDLDDGDLERLHRTMKDVLRRSMRAGHVPTTSRWLTGRRDTDDAPCPRCGRPLRRDRIDARRTVWCQYCQPA